GDSNARRPAKRQNKSPPSPAGFRRACPRSRGSVPLAFGRFRLFLVFLLLRVLVRTVGGLGRIRVSALPRRRVQRRQRTDLAGGLFRRLLRHVVAEQWQEHAE